MSLLPDDTPWGEDKWSKTYREDNKINCYASGTAPCKTACPAPIAVQGYIQMASEGRYAEAPVRAVAAKNRQLFRGDGVRPAGLDRAFTQPGKV